MRLLVLLAVLASAGAVPPAAPAVVRVAAASDLRYALDEISRVLAERQPAVVVRPTYGSSGTLHAQLRQGAPYDVFLSADAAYPADLAARGLGAEADLFTYAIGRLVLWVPSGSSLPIERGGLRAVAGVRRLAIANPAHAPYGRAAQAALESAGLWDTLRSRLVLGESVSQAAQFVESGGAEAGLIARSLAVAAPLRGRGRSWDVPSNAHPPLVQGGLLLRHARSRSGALALRDFLLGDEGRRILERNGFAVLPR